MPARPPSGSTTCSVAASHVVPGCHTATNIVSLVPTTRQPSIRASVPSIKASSAASSGPVVTTGLSPATGGSAGESCT